MVGVRKIILKASSSGSSNDSILLNTNKASCEISEGTVESSFSTTPPESEGSLTLSEDDESGFEDENEESFDYQTITSSPSKLTPRQRSLFFSEEAATNSFVHPTRQIIPQKRMSEKDFLLRDEKIRRTKMLRDQRLEQSKQDTIEKLLKKQTTAQKGSSLDKKVKEKSLLDSEGKCKNGHSLYIDNQNGKFLILNEDELKCQTNIQINQNPNCKFCSQIRSSKTNNIPICARLDCYKKAIKMK